MKNLITILLLFVGLAAMGQIPINTNFDVSTPNPIDGRMTIATLDDTSTIASLYAGLLTVTEDTGEIWVYDGGQWLQFESADGNGIYSGSGSTPNSIVEVENTAGLRFDQKSSIGFSSYVEIYNDYSNPVEDEFGADMFNFIRFFDKGPINENVFIGMNENEGFAISSSDNISIKGKSQLYFEGSDHEFAIQNDSVFLIMQNGRFSYISNSSASKTGIMLEGFGEIDNTGIGGNYSALRPNSLAPKALTISGLEEENVSVNANNNALSINNLGSLSLTNSGSSGGFVSGTLISVPTRMFRDGGGGQNYVSIEGGGEIRLFDQQVSRFYTLRELAGAALFPVVEDAPSTATIAIDVDQRARYWRQIDLSSAPSPITLQIDNPEESGTYLFQFTGVTTNDVTFPANANFYDGSAIGTVTLSGDGKFTCRFDGADFWCEQ